MKPHIKNRKVRFTNAVVLLLGFGELSILKNSVERK
jgi:hypothetical protein